MSPCNLVLVLIIHIRQLIRTCNTSSRESVETFPSCFRWASPSCTQQMRQRSFHIQLLTSSIEHIHKVLGYDYCFWKKRHVHRKHPCCLCQKKEQKKSKAALKSLFHRMASVAKVASIRDDFSKQEAVTPGSVFTCVHYGIFTYVQACSEYIKLAAGQGG